MSGFEKISAQQALQAATAGAPLVNAYSSQEQWLATQVPRAISFKEFQEQLPKLSREKEILLYCACPQDASAVKRAIDLYGQGFRKVKVVEGGYDALRAAGPKVARA